MAQSRWHIAAFKRLVREHRHGRLVSISTVPKTSLFRFFSTTITRDNLSSPLFSRPSEIYDYNVKLNSLNRQFEEARKLFNKMPHRDAFSYATMIKIHLKNDDLLGAESIFLNMPIGARGVVAETAMVDGYARAGRLDDARDLFDAMPHKNVYSWTCMISGYFGGGHVKEAVELFNQMPLRNIVSWTNLVQGFAQNGLAKEARCAFDRMPERNIVSWTVMVKCYVDNGMIDEALSIFNQMPSRNLYAWNVILSGCLEYERVSEAVRMFGIMPLRNSISWTVMITGLAKNGLVNQAREYFDRMPDKDIPAWNAMITAYANEGLMVKAEELFHLMPEKNTVTWNAMIEGYAGNGSVHGQSFKLFTLMLRSHHPSLRPNIGTITSLVASCQRMIEAAASHSLLVRLGFGQSPSVISGLTTAYSKLGDLISAFAAFTSLQNKDGLSWRSMIFSYSNHGHAKQALQAFARMLRSQPESVDESTFVALISACGHKGLVDKGQRIFNSMRSGFGLETKKEHYACLIDMLGRAGKLEEVIEVINTMPQSEIDCVVIGSLLSSSSLLGELGAARMIRDRLVDLIEDDRTGGGYVLMGNTFAACGKYEEFAGIRKELRERKIKKVPGVSEIEVSRENRVFFSGERSQTPDLEGMYGYLKPNLRSFVDGDLSIFDVG